MPLPRLGELLVAATGLPRFRATQLYDALYRQRLPSLDAVSTLSARDKATLAAAFSFDRGTVASDATSGDGTRKWLLKLPGDGAAVETVVIPAAFRAGGDSSRGGARATVCVSSQVGCSLACAFCHTGTQRLMRNLTAADIVLQVLHAAEATGAPVGSTAAAAAAAGAPPPLPQHRLSNIVFMGQGEPGYNWRAVSTAIAVLTDPHGLAFAPRKITVSTAGVAPIIPRVATETPGVRLAISLHAATNDLRSRLMDINRHFPVEAVMEGAAAYLKARAAEVAARRGGANSRAGGDDSDEESGSEDEGRPVARVVDTRTPARPTSRSQTLRRVLAAAGADSHNSNARVRVTFEYVMLAGVNDGVTHADQLAALLTSYLPSGAAHVNLIAFNPWPGSTFAPSSRAACLAFQDTLLAAGIRTHIRHSRGVDILGACGQLRSAADPKVARTPAAAMRAGGGVIN